MDHYQAVHKPQRTNRFNLIIQILINFKGRGVDFEVLHTTPWALISPL